LPSPAERICADPLGRRSHRLRSHPRPRRGGRTLPSATPEGGRTLPSPTPEGSKLVAGGRAASSRCYHRYDGRDTGMGPPTPVRRSRHRDGSADTGTTVAAPGWVRRHRDNGRDTPQRSRNDPTVATPEGSTGGSDITEPVVAPRRRGATTGYQLGPLRGPEGRLWAQRRTRSRKSHNTVQKSCGRSIISQWLLSISVFTGRLGRRRCRLKGMLLSGVTSASTTPG